jgi:hypothetical protein
MLAYLKVVGHGVVSGVGAGFANQGEIVSLLYQAAAATNVA